MILTFALGGYGYSSEYDIERLVRSILVTTFYAASPRSSGGSSRRAGASEH